MSGGSEDVARDRAGGCGEEAGLEVGGHGGIDEAGLDGDDANTSGVKAVAQAIEVNAEGGLGGAVDVIAAASAVARDG